jgi:hypothetical protein
MPLISPGPRPWFHAFRSYLRKIETFFVRVIKELQSRFAHFMKTGDDSKIPADLQRVIFSVVRFWFA